MLWVDRGYDMECRSDPDTALLTTMLHMLEDCTSVEMLNTYMGEDVDGIFVGCYGEYGILVSVTGSTVGDSVAWTLIPPPVSVLTMTSPMLMTPYLSPLMLSNTCHEAGGLNHR